MVEVIICSLMFGSLVSAAIVLIVSALNAIFEHGLRGFFSRFYKNLKISSSFVLWASLVLSLIFIWPIYDARNKIEAEEKGECICHCKRCQKNSEMIEKFLIRASKLEAENFKLWQTNAQLRSEKVAKEENP